MSMSTKDFDLFTLSDGFRELDSQLSRFKKRVKEQRWSEAHVRLGTIIRLLHGMRKTVERLEKELSP